MWMTRWLAFLRRTLASRQAEQDLHDDVQGYADLVTDELIASGMTPDEARRRARVSLGGVETVKESVRAGRTGAWLEQVWRDIGYGLRGLRRSPGFATTAILTIGLGIGVNTTIFSVIDSALFKPLPYDRPEELVDLGHHVRAGLPMETTFVGGMDWQEIGEWRAARAIFQGVEAYKSGGTPRQWLERDETMRVGTFTPGLPALLGVKPRAGRLFTVAEADAGADVIVIADSLWARAFARRTDAIGSSMTLANRRMTIVGVMPATFRYGPAGNGQVAAWTALAEHAISGVRDSSTATPLLRLRTGLTPQAALPLADAVAKRMQQARPAQEPWKPEFMSFERFPHGLANSQQSPLLFLLAAAGLVLLVACVNIANLLFTRGASRQEELAMRSALGASRGRLVRLLLAEGLAVALLGGFAAIVLAKWALGAVVAIIPTHMRTGMFVVSAPELDWRVLIFALGATTLVALLSALWPAISGSRIAIRQITGRGQLAGVTRRRRRIGRVLQTAQVAMASVLAITGGLFATSFARLMTTDLGYDPRGLGRVSFSLPATYESDDAQRLAVAELLARVRATPGVRIAAIGYSPASSGTGGFVLPGASKGLANSAIRRVGDGYFDTTGIRIVAGRPIQAEDVASSARVAVIDGADARRVFGNESPLGRRFAYSPYVPDFTIVGVASHVELTDFAQPNPRVGVYLPESLSTNFVFRTDGDLDIVTKNVRATIQAFDPTIRAPEAGAAADVYEEMETYAAPRFYVVLVSVFAVLALVTAAVGLYGLLAHSVGQRRREIGVRVALGSTPGQVRALVLKEAFGPVAAGLVAGGVAAWWATRLLGSLIYGIGPHDPRAFAIGALALIVTALFATIAPARRATGVDPIVALRAE